MCRVSDRRRVCIICARVRPRPPMPRCGTRNDTGVVPYGRGGRCPRRHVSGKYAWRSARAVSRDTRRSRYSVILRPEGRRIFPGAAEAVIPEKILRCAQDDRLWRLAAFALPRRGAPRPSPCRRVSRNDTGVVPYDVPCLRPSSGLHNLCACASAAADAPARDAERHRGRSLRARSPLPTASIAHCGTPWQTAKITAPEASASGAVIFIFLPVYFPAFI